MFLCYSSLTNRMNGVMWTFWTLYITLTLYTMGLFLSVIVTMDSIKKDLSLVTEPVILLVYQALFCAIGQHLRDSAAMIEEAAYGCNWYLASIKFRKMILMLLIRSQRETIMDAKPFFELNFALFAKVHSDINNLILQLLHFKYFR